MVKYPKKYYGQPGFNDDHIYVKGEPFNPQYCAYAVWPNNRPLQEHQCREKPGHGQSGLFCEKHARILR